MRLQGTCIFYSQRIAQNQLFARLFTMKFCHKIYSIVSLSVCEEGKFIKTGGYTNTRGVVMAIAMP